MRSFFSTQYSKTPVLFILCLNGLILFAGFAFYIIFSSLAIVLIPTLFYIFFHIRQNRRLKKRSGRFNISFPGSPHLVNVKTVPNYRNGPGFRISIGNSQCSLPYTTGIFNILLADPITPAKTHANLFSENNLRSLFETSMVEYELLNGGWLLQLEPMPMDTNSQGKTGFHSKEFAARATRAEVRLVSIDLTYLKKNCNHISIEHGRHLGNGNKTLQTFAPFGFSSFHDADGLVFFLSHLRKLSGGKPVGLRILIHNHNEFSKICFAFRKAEIYPDFIIAEGMDPQKENNPFNQSYENCLPVYEALEIITKTLHTYGLDRQIVIISEQQVSSGFELLKGIAFGAQMVHSTITYPTMNGNPATKYNDSIKEDASYFQKSVMRDLARMMHAFQFENLNEITWANFMRNLKGLNDYTADFTDGTGLEHEPFHVLHNHKLMKKDLKLNIRNRKN